MVHLQRNYCRRELLYYVHTVYNKVRWVTKEKEQRDVTPYHEIGVFASAQLAIYRLGMVSPCYLIFRHGVGFFYVR